MSLNHDFLLLDARLAPKTEYGNHHHSPEAILLHYDLLGYINDMLQWVPTENPAKRLEEQVGLNFCGPTVIGHRGAAQFHAVCQALAVVFTLGPELLNLRGYYTFPADSEIGLEDEKAMDRDEYIDKILRSGHYDRLEVNRDDLVMKLTTLADWATQVQLDPNLYILHLGV